MEKTGEISSTKTMKTKEVLTEDLVGSKKFSRRDFLKLTSGVVASLALKKTPVEAAVQLIGANEVKTGSEKEPSPFQPALVVDVPPFVDGLKELREKGHVDERTQPLDLDAFLKKHLGTSFGQIMAAYGSEAKRDFPGEANNLSLGKTLLKHGREREAVILNLAFQWAEHGLMVGNHAQMVRREVNKKIATPAVDWSGKLEGLSPAEYILKHDLTFLEFNEKFPEPTPPKEKSEPRFPVQPYEIFPLQDYVASIEKSEEVDEFGNPYYEIIFDHLRLARDLKEKLKQNPTQKVINFSGNFQARIRLGYRLPENYLEDVNRPEAFVRQAEGWTQLANQSLPDQIKDGWEERSSPAIALETGYIKPEALVALKEFCDLLPKDVTFVTAAGNSQTDLRKITPPGFEFPQNCVLVAALNPSNQTYGDKEGLPIPAHLFYGDPSQVYYLQAIDLNMSSFAASHVSEWLVQQNVQSPREAKRLLNQHSKVFKKRDMRILDFGRMPIAGWDDPELFEEAKT